MAGRGEASESKGASVSQPFNFQAGELVLVKWSDGMVYFAKIKKVDRRHSKCTVVFDDKSQDDANFNQIHSVDETTTDIICIKCKKDDSDSPNEIVLCDTCGIGFHQRCHVPPIPAYALELDTPWNCIYCQKGSKCPYLTESLDVLQNLLSDEELSQDGASESLVTVESDQEEYEGATKVTVTFGSARRRKGRKTRGGHRQGMKPSAVSPKAWKHKVVSSGRTRCSSSPFKEPDALNSPSSSVEAGPVVTAGKRRRRQYAGRGVKKQKRSSVESRTVSVKRLSGPGPLLEDSSTSSDHRDTPPCSDKEPSLPPFSPEIPVPIREQPQSATDSIKRPRTLRVSLSIPGEVEPGTPLDKVVSKASGTTQPSVIQGTPGSNLPAWDEITSTAGPKFAQSPLWASSFAKTSTPLASPPQHQGGSPSDKPVNELSSLAEEKGGPGKKRKLDTFGKEQSVLAGTTSPPDDVFESSDSSSSSQKISISTSVTTSSGNPQSVISGTVSSSTPVTSRPKVISLAGTAGSPVVTTSSAVPVVAMLASPLPFTPSSKSLDHAASPSLPGVVVGSSTSGRDFTEQPQVGYKTESKAANQELVTPGFRQGQHLSKVVVSTITMATTTRNTQHSPQTPVSMPSQAVGSTATKLVSPGQVPLVQQQVPGASSQTPVSQPAEVVGTTATKLISPGQASLVPGQAPLVPGQASLVPGQASLVPGQASLVPGQASQVPGQAPLVPGQASLVPGQASLVPKATPAALPPKGGGIQGQSLAQTPVETTAKRTVADADVIITGVERKEVFMMPSAPVLSHSKQPPRPHNLRPSDSRPKKVIAKTVDVLPPYSLSSPSRCLTGTKLVMSPAANQTAVTLQAMVVSPGTHRSASPAAAANGKGLLISTAGVGQTEPLVYAVPASEPAVESTTGVLSNGVTPPVQPHMCCVIQETAPQRPPPPYRPPIMRPMPITASSVAPTTLVYTQAAPVAHSVSDQGPEMLGSHQDERLSSDQPQPGIFYYTVSSTQAGSLSTTKPYAIVTALPTSGESRSLVAIPQTTGSHGGVHVQVQAAGGEQPALVGRGQVGVVTYSHPPQRKPQKMSPTSTAGAGTVVNSWEGKYDSDLRKTLQTITHKIGDAFTSCSEDMLLAAFEDAWKKFQANRRKYEALARLEKSAVQTSSPSATSKMRTPGPPNAEVINSPGISKLSLVRTANAKPKPIVPKPSQVMGTQAVGVLSSPSPTVPSPSQQNIAYAYTPRSNHHQVIVQPVNPNDAPYTIFTVAPKPIPQKSYQTGLYIPAPPASDASIGQKADAAVISSAAHQIVIAQPVLQPHPHPQVPKQAAVTRQAAPTGPTLALTSPKVVQQLPRKQKQMVPVRRRTPGKTIRSCALCGKEATYLCSGCHSEWYCGRECQLKAWDDHSDHCKA